MGRKYYISEEVVGDWIYVFTYKTLFGESARAVLERAYGEARSSFKGLQDVGFWFDPEMADDVVRAIVGLDGVARMEALTSSD